MLYELGKKSIEAVLKPLGLQLKIHPSRKPLRYPEATKAEIDQCKKYKAFTRTSPERQWTLLKAIEYINKNKIPGDVVECGVWRGGNMMLAKDLNRSSSSDRRFWLFDTFSGMAPPGEHDSVEDGRDVKHVHQVSSKENHNEWCYSPIEEVIEGFETSGLLGDDVIFRKGMVEDTLLSDAIPQEIALLRLDTDFYDSTKIELEILYPKLSIGGVLIIDDYGNWHGARKATDEYFAEEGPLLFPIDQALRMAIKVK